MILNMIMKKCYLNKKRIYKNKNLMIPDKDKNIKKLSYFYVFVKKNHITMTQFIINLCKTKIILF